MRILFILENYYPNIGGVETLFRSLAESLASESFEITVLTNKFDDALPSSELMNGVKIRRLNLKNRYLFTFLAGFRATQLAFKNDLIHTTSYNAAIPAYIASLFSGKKLIITFHEVWSDLWFKLPFMNKLSLFLHYLFEAFILKLSYYKFVAVSNYTKESLINSGIAPDKIVSIYNGIDYEEFPIKETNNSNNTFQFCYFGRLGISKGLDLILKACQILKTKQYEFKFLLIVPSSSPAFLKRIKKIIQQYKIQDWILFKHDLAFEELKQSVLSSNAVVIPSYSEGFCYTAVESMAMDVPIISSSRGALKEVVGGKFLEMDEQSAESLANCMEKALDNQWDHRESKKFPLSDSIKAYMQLYKGIELS